MYRRFRLSTHRKNEFRKHRAGKQKCVVTTETLRVEQASHEDILAQQLPGTHPAETSLVVTIPRSVISVLRMSVDIELYLRTPIESLVRLKSKLSRISILPQGTQSCDSNFYCMYMYIYVHVGLHVHVYYILYMYYV